MSTLTKTQAPGRQLLDSEERRRLLEENLPEVRYTARRIHDRLPSHGTSTISSTPEFGFD